MAFDPVPWMVGGGAIHSADIGRMIPWLISGGESGIILPTDLYVKAQTTPGGSVIIGPGGGVMDNKYPGGTIQAYVCRNVSDTTVPVSSTGGSALVRYVIVRVYDPQYPGQPAPPSVQNGPYIFPELVTSITGLNYPFIALAKLDQPANTAAITQAMLTDIRTMVRPREKTEQRSNATVASDPGLTLSSTSAGGEMFPDTGYQDIFIPSWATSVQIRATWTGVYYSTGGKYGRYWVAVGASPWTSTVKTQEFAWDAAENAAGYRDSWPLADAISIPVAMRGTTQRFSLMARKTISGGGAIKLDALSGTEISVRFLEKPTPSTA